MASKKSEKKEKVSASRVVRPTQVKAIVLHEIALSPRQEALVKQTTPEQFVKTKPGRGGKNVQYIEGGYVINKLNEMFSPLGWEFKIVERGETERKNEKSAEGEVWVYGELTVIDHKAGFRVSKGQYGQHPIHEKVPIGDAFKAAATDSLKKCASMLGIGLDVYWGMLDTSSPDGDQKAPDPAELYERALVMIKGTRNIGGLIEYEEKLNESTKFTKQQKEALVKAVRSRVSEIEAQQEQP